MSLTRFFTFFGDVQWAMFRQTIMRAALRRNIRAGATNCGDDKHKVIATFCGETRKIDDLVSVLGSGKVLNSWKAKVTSWEEHANGISVEEHEVTTENVDSIQWPGKVEIFID
jgi:acylphosphatase